jgi:hypothetical protein
MAYRNFYDRLNKLIAKLDESFTPNYGTDNMESFRKLNANSFGEKVNSSEEKVKHIHIHQHNSPQLFSPYIPYYCRPIGYMMPYTPPTTIINNYPNVMSNAISTTSKTTDKDKKEEEKKEETTQSTLGGLAIIGTVAVSGTYLLATDEYTSYVNSGIEIEINNFVTDIILMMKNDSEITEAAQKIKYCFDDWSRLFKDRTYNSRNAKRAGVLSGIAVGGGLMLGSSMVMLGGGFGLIASGCVFTWNYFTKKIRSETNIYNDLLNAMRDNLTTIEDKYYKFTYPEVVTTNSGRGASGISMTASYSPQSTNCDYTPTSCDTQSVNYNVQSMNYNFQPTSYNTQPTSYNTQPISYNPQPTSYDQGYNTQSPNYNSRPTIYDAQYMNMNESQSTYYTANNS